MRQLAPIVGDQGDHIFHVGDAGSRIEQGEFQVLTTVHFGARHDRVAGAEQRFADLRVDFVSDLVAEARTRNKAEDWWSAPARAALQSPDAPVAGGGFAAPAPASLSKASPSCCAPIMRSVIHIFSASKRRVVWILLFTVGCAFLLRAERVKVVGMHRNVTKMLAFAHKKRRS